MKKNKSIDQSLLGKNPFVNSLSIPVNKIKGKNYVMDDDVLVKEIIELEATRFTKIFVSSERRKIVNDLSSCSQRLFLWLIFEIDEGCDWVYINKDRYLKEQNLSYNTYTKARDELIRYGFISPTVIKDVFWINPDMFFQGNRIKKYRDKIQ
jgi:hypothetical protein